MSVVSFVRIDNERAIGMLIVQYLATGEPLVSIGAVGYAAAVLVYLTLGLAGRFL